MFRPHKFMKWLLVFSILILACVGLSEADKGPAAYYVQLIRGTDEDKAPEPNSKLLSPQETGSFRSVFKWKSYWQMSLQRLEVAEGRRTKIRLNPEREVEIDLTQPEHRSVRAFHNGKLMQCALCPRGEARTLIGGDRDSNSAWFIVISRKAPQ